MSDRLKMDYINSLPQPLVAHFYGGSEWPVYEIDVETGLMKIDVCGKIETRRHIGEVSFFRDMDGVEHDSDSFYVDERVP